MTTQWHWEEGHDGYDMPCLMAGDELVCHFGDSTRFYPSEGSAPSDEHKRLIAAAPDMLDALRMALPLLRVTNADPVCIQLVDAAIKAARGLE